MSHLLQMRGLKQKLLKKGRKHRGVASFTDAWIETKSWRHCEKTLASHLLQMRGLKLTIEQKRIITSVSHLLQMRGLKPPTVRNINIGNVASFTDAWIETIISL